MPLVKRFFAGACALVMIAAIAGCGTTPYSGYVSASPQTATQIERAAAHGRVMWSPEATAQIALVQNPDYNNGRIPAAVAVKSQLYAVSCQEQIGPQIAGPLQSGAMGGLSYGAAEAAGAAAGTALTYGAPIIAPEAAIGGLVGFGGGLVNGLVSGSYSAAAAKGQCAEAFLRDFVRDHPEYRGAHLVIVYSGKRWGDSSPPALRYALQPQQRVNKQHAAMPQPAINPATAPYPYTQRGLPSPDDVLRH